MSSFSRTAGSDNAQICMLFILAHGGREEQASVSYHLRDTYDVIYGSDGKHIQVKTILSYFSNDTCPALQGVPKLVVLQACRGSKLINNSYKFIYNYNGVDYISMMRVNDM